MSEREEDRIVSELQRGEDVEKNFHHLFSRYQGLVRRFFVRRGFDPGQCDELTQEVFFRVYQDITSYRGDADFSTWLFGIVTNVYRNEVRRQGAQKRSTVEVTLSEQADETQIGLQSGSCCGSFKRQSSKSFGPPTRSGGGERPST